LRFEGLLALLQSSLARPAGNGRESWCWITGSGEETQEGELDR
jgi:hypothetical protein